MPDGGFVRILSGRSLLLVDAGPPPPPGFDATAHAGALSFEMSVGRERLIVNCGAGILPAWRDALRATAAHSTVSMGDTSSSEFRAGVVSRRPAHVTLDHRQASGAHWLDLSQDGYAPGFGAVHHRRIYIAEGGDDIRGEDSVVGERLHPFTLRFHLHPSVKVTREGDEFGPGEEGGAVLLTLPSGNLWRFRVDSGRVSVEESIYLGGDSPRRSTQIVIGVTPQPAAAEGGSDQGAVTPVEETPPPKAVRWALIRVEP
jgi:uncharacterized heparinase superfamily protein